MGCPCAVNVPAMLSPEFPKRSFLRFAVVIDVAALQDECLRITSRSWLANGSEDIHPATTMCVLRGGQQGDARDICEGEPHDHPMLESAPELRRLLAVDGPFGGARFAYLFRVAAQGVSLSHVDNAREWQDNYRIHVPVFTNPGAFIVAQDRSLHFGLGSAWSFDNSQPHGLVNGDAARVHLLMDVGFNQTLRRRLEEAEFLHGEEYPEHQARIRDKTLRRAPYPGDVAIREAIARNRADGVSDAIVASMLNLQRIPARDPDALCWTADMIARLSGNPSLP
ncbi:aspartyl/asparaginyl beta-hydroxylase domain-containing protein [Solimonas sp. SE-A11]|uniref:aspartyl/asparaginyl beta-hydroxylase domain-containing protein n=1 Tax=Solimonas sp. SE-A11 TaxID=3054954 RepID=UPI00259C7D38|nr:aspartyl/asparaginyl beta-hydroxylase domain-containing protein [Solimonas sp. SE-A11]MDM4771752.1 aspartyl/asparaginyl beta-hydroxylase domain-containing protein [Solimonas sp. SE-A11]